jgi:hypothetical protein
MNRRGFLSRMLGGVAAIAVADFDPEKALYIPGKKHISIPSSIQPRAKLRRSRIEMWDGRGEWVGIGDVLEFRCESIEVTTLSDTYRRYLPQPLSGRIVLDEESPIHDVFFQHVMREYRIGGEIRFEALPRKLTGSISFTGIRAELELDVVRPQQLDLSRAYRSEIPSRNRRLAS